MHNPHKYAIFDARISASLNSLHIVYNTAGNKLFPVLTSRNNTIKKGNKLIKKTAKEVYWKTAQKCSFYQEYLSLLENIISILDSKLDVSIYTIEMLLFAKAEKLVEKAFPNEKF